MSFELPTLPFDKKSLAPYISEETIEFHYGKHHQAYVDKLNTLIADTELEQKNLIEIVRASEGGIFNNAAQVYNHDFYWHCLSNDKDNKKLSPEFDEALNLTFGSLEKFKEDFTKAALGLFGSGWVWLVKGEAGLEIVATSNADTPIKSWSKPLLVCDVWEHAYYIDYRNARAKYLEAFWKVVNWRFVSQKFAE